MATARRTKKTAPAEEIIEEDVVVSDDVDDFDLEDDAVEEAPAPKAKKAKAPAEKAPAKPKAAPIEFGSAWLATHVNEQAGTTYDSYNLRILLRKLTKDGSLTRAESEGRARYSFTGPEDPQVKQIVEAVKSGAADRAKQERLDKLKADRASKPKTTKAKKAAAVEAEPEVDEEDEFEVEDI